MNEKGQAYAGHEIVKTGTGSQCKRPLLKTRLFLLQNSFFKRLLCHLLPIEHFTNFLGQ